MSEKITNERYKGLLSNLNAGVVVHAPDTSIILSNERASEILGLTKDQLEGRTAMDPYWHFVDNDLHRVELEDFPISKVLRTLQPIKDEILGVVIDRVGTNKWVMVNGLPIFKEDGSLQEVVISFVDITALRTTQTELKNTLEEKTILLREVHHRIKNNIMNIESLLMLQLSNTENEETIQLLTDTTARVQSMRVLYQILTNENESKKSADISSYISNLSNAILSLFPNNSKLNLDLKVASIDVSSETLFSLGIVINELMTNSMKHAFDKIDNPRISISTENDGDSLVLNYADNGPGYDETSKPKSNGGGLGIMLIKMLSKHSGGEVEMSGENGVNVRLKIKLK